MHEVGIGAKFIASAYVGAWRKERMNSLFSHNLIHTSVTTFWVLVFLNRGKCALCEV